MKNQSIFFLTLVLCGFFSQNLNAQDFGSDSTYQPEPKKYSLKDHIFFGGNVGAQFGTSTLITLAPLVGYKLTKKWSVGIQTTYSYVDIKYLNYRYKDHIFGGSVFTRYFIFNNFFAHAEYEALNGHWRRVDERFNVYSLFLGGGYMFPISDNAGFVISAMFNVLPSTYNPYRNPIINAGFTFGL